MSSNTILLKDFAPEPVPDVDEVRNGVVISNDFLIDFCRRNRTNVNSAAMKIIHDCLPFVKHGALASALTVAFIDENGDVPVISVEPDSFYAAVTDKQVAEEEKKTRELKEAEDKEIVERRTTELHKLAADLNVAGAVDMFSDWRMMVVAMNQKVDESNLMRLKRGEAPERVDDFLSAIFKFSPYFVSTMLRAMVVTGINCLTSYPTEKELREFTGSQPSAAMIEAANLFGKIQGSIPLEKSSLTLLSSEQSTRDHPVSVLLSDDTGVGPDTILTEDALVIRGNKKQPAFNYVANQLTHEIVERAADRYALPVLKSMFVVNDAYIDMKVTPHHAFTRASLKQTNVKKENQALRQFAGFVIVPNAQEIAVEGVTQTIHAMRADLGALPALTWGAPPHGMYAALNATTSGRSFLGDFSKQYDSYKLYPEVTWDNYFELMIFTMKNERDVAKLPKAVMTAGNVQALKLLQSIATSTYLTSLVPSACKLKALTIATGTSMAVGASGPVLATMSVASSYHSSYTINKDPGKPARVIVIHAHANLLKLGVPITHSNMSDAQHSSGAGVPTRGTVFEEQTGRVGEKTIIVSNTGYEQIQRIASEEKFATVEHVKNPQFTRRMVLPPLTDAFLIDLTVPGRLYNPQALAKQAAGEKVKSSKFLYDSIDKYSVLCLYSVEDLDKTLEFCVYVNVASVGVTCATLVGRNAHWRFRVIPCGLTGLCGVYLHGSRINTGHGHVLVKEIAIASCVHRMRLFGELFDSCQVKYKKNMLEGLGLIRDTLAPLWDYLSTKLGGTDAWKAVARLEGSRGRESLAAQFNWNELERLSQSPVQFSSGATLAEATKQEQAELENLFQSFSDGMLLTV